MSPTALGSRARGVLAGVALLLLLAAALLALRGPGDSPSGTEGVSADHRVTPAPASAVDGARAPPGLGAEEDRLHVWLRPVTEVRYVLSVPRISYLDVWPAPDDPRWDHAWLERSDAVATLLEFGAAGGKFRQGAKVLRLTEPASETPRTPEEALVHLIRAWMSMDVARDRALEEYTRRHLGDGGSWEALGAAEREALVAADPPPLADSEPLLRVAGEILERWPDHPIADHARMVAFVSALPRFQADVPLRTSLIDAMDAFEDPRFRERAAVEIVEVGTFNPPDPALIAHLLEGTPSTADDGLRVAEWAARWCASRQDWGCTATALSRLREARAGYCADSDERPRCEHAATTERDLAARLVALGHGEARTWKEALAAEAWRCWLEGEPFEATLRGAASASGGAWSIGEWDVESPFTACLSRVTGTAPFPERDVRVHLIVEGDP